MSRSCPRWLAAAAGIMAIAAFGLASPAAAETSAGAAIDVVAGDVSVAPGYGHSQTVWVHGPASLTSLDKPTYTFDLGELAQWVTVTVDEPGGPACTQKDAVVTCTDPDSPEISADLWNPTLFVTFNAKAEAPIGATATVKTTVSADNVTASTTSWTLTIAQGVNLKAVDSTVSAAAGASVKIPVVVTNKSDTTVNGVVVWMIADYGITLSRASNCTYTEDPAGETIAACQFDTPELAAGKTYQVQVPATIAATAPAPLTTLLGAWWYTAQDWTDQQSMFGRLGAPEGEKGSGPALTLEEATAPMQSMTVPQTDTNLFDNYAMDSVKLTGSRAADLAAVGATASGAVGATVDVKVGIKNNGPVDAVFFVDGQHVLAYLDVPVPEGTKVTGAPAECAPVGANGPEGDRAGEAGAAEYACLFDVIKVGETYSYTFGLHIDRVVPDATSTIALVAEDGSPLKDPNQANNTAKLVINPSSGSGGGGGLPITGAKAGLIGGAGAVFLALGVVFFVLNRRRRTRFVVED